VELTEKLLISLGGWDAIKQARALHAAGRVTEASYEPPVLKGRCSDGGKQFLAGLRMRNAIDVENLCPCRDSRVRGIICAHSLAAGLEVLKPSQMRIELMGMRGPHLPASGLRKEKPVVQRLPATDETPVVELTLEGSLRHLEAEISFRYSQPGLANSEKEIEALTRLMKAGFQDYKGKAALQGEESVIRFFATELPKLKQSWQIKEGERFLHVTRDFVRIEPQFAIREQSDGWLDFHVHYVAGKEAMFSAADINTLLQSGGHTKLKDGRVAVVDGTLATDLEEVLRDCNPRQERGTYRVPPAQRAYLEASMAEWQGGAGAWRREGAPPFSAPAVEKIHTAIPLRSYQIEGTAWLLAKARASLGGLLADEMGLGKTVQALAMIEQLPGPVLVICPSSLVWNWKREAAHFLPALPVLTIDGPNRDKLFARIPRHRLLITSYALLRRDLEHYSDLDFSAVLLDEAQHIKNPDSQNAKAACALRARSRFILTGTPIENSLRDLWSLFEFLLPGYLGSRDDFKDRYETPLLEGAQASPGEKQIPSPVWARLRRRLAPYFLRRLKRDILTELPDKIEQVLEIELSDDQKAAYTQLQQAARAQVDQFRDQGQGGAARMRVLTALLRLRQACCDLRLLGAEKGGSAKLNALLELLGETIDGGHRALVFSQFTGMLDLIGEALGERGIPFCRLDGSTRDRGQVVTRFQTDATFPVFLISLKAGGVGLNLTAADTVIHYDPWWNPAVEAQATDRAHRIGQKSVVTAIKLIARDTVEERVLKMQEKKKELLAGMTDAEAVLGTLTAEELTELVG
jgi:superfamily II DNA or RNA helicase